MAPDDSSRAARGAPALLHDTAAGRGGIAWGAAAWAGLIGGAAFLALEMLMVPLFVGGSAWGPLRMIAAIVLGREVLPPPQTFDIGVLLTALVVHFLLAEVYAFGIAGLVQRLTTLGTLLMGAAAGVGLYVVNFYLFTGLFGWFTMARTWVTVVTHIVFGVVTAWAYRSLLVPRRPYRTTW